MNDKEHRPDASGRLTGIVRHIGGTFRSAQDGSTKLAEALPGTMSATTTRARATITALQRLPDSTLRWLAASSIGLGAGLYVSGRRRLTVAAGVAPAILAGAAIALRSPKRSGPISHELR